MANPIARQPWDVLVPHQLKAGADVDATLTRLRQYATLLLQWNRAVSNLISRNDEVRLVERHFIESLAPAYWLNETGIDSWVDFGSGGGLPAIPLAICGVGKHWLLVESRRTKTLFLRRVIQDMGLRNIVVANARLEDIVSESADDEAMSIVSRWPHGEAAGFTSRATLPLLPTLSLATHFVSRGGRAFLWKGSRREDEMKSDPSWQRAWELDGLLGVGNEQTVVCRFARTAEPD